MSASDWMELTWRWSGDHGTGSEAWYWWDARWSIFSIFLTRRVHHQPSLTPHMLPCSHWHILTVITMEIPLEYSQTTELSESITVMLVTTSHSETCHCDCHKIIVGVSFLWFSFPGIITQPVSGIDLLAFGHCNRSFNLTRSWDVEQPHRFWRQSCKVDNNPRIPKIRSIHDII